MSAVTAGSLRVVEDGFDDDGGALPATDDQNVGLRFIAELLGLYVLLVAGTNILPPSWRFTRWKLWMRIELILWWLVIFMGILTYYVWYAAPRSR